MERKATLLCALLAAVLLSIGISAQGNVTSSLNTTSAATSVNLTMSNDPVAYGETQVLTAALLGGAGPFIYNFLVYNASGVLEASVLTPYISPSNYSFPVLQQAAWGFGVFTANVVAIDSAYPGIPVANSILYVVQSTTTTSTASSTSSSASTSTSTSSTVSLATLPGNAMNATNSISPTMPHNVISVGTGAKATLAYQNGGNKGMVMIQGNAIRLAASRSVLREVDVGLAATNLTVNVSITNQSQVPVSFAQPAASVYQFVQINGSIANSVSTDIDQYITSVTYNFTVPSAWIGSMGTNAASILLFKYSPSLQTWNPLTTTLIGSNQTSYFYSATSNSFSAYVVGFVTGSGSATANTVSNTIVTGGYAYATYFWGGAISTVGRNSIGATATTSSWTVDGNYLVRSTTASATSNFNTVVIGHNSLNSAAFTTNFIKSANGNVVNAIIAGIGANVIFANGKAYSSNGVGTAATVLTFNAAANSFIVLVYASAGTVMSAFSTNAPGSSLAVNVVSASGSVDQVAIQTVNSLTSAVGSFNAVISTATSASKSMVAYVFPPYAVNLVDNPATGSIMTSNMVGGPNTYASGQTINVIGTQSINAIVPTGYRFASWTVSSSANLIVTSTSTQNTFLTVEGNGILTANFAPPTVAITSGPTNAIADVGQYEYFTATVTNGNGQPYTYNWIASNAVSGALIGGANMLFTSCTLATNALGWIVGANEPTNSPVAWNVIVTDTLVTYNSVDSGGYGANTALAAGLLTESNTVIDNTQYSLLTANPSGGSMGAGSSYNWFANTVGNPNCNSANVVGGQTLKTYLANPSSTTYYSYNVIDSASTKTTVCNLAGNSITVQSTPSVSTPVPSNVLLDSGQMVVYNTILTSPSGGSSFTVNLVNMGSAGLASSLTGQSAGTLVFVANTPAVGTDTFEVVAADGSTTSPFVFTSGVNTIVVNTAMNPQLSSTPALPATLNTGQTITFNAQVGPLAMGGSSPFVVNGVGAWTFTNNQPLPSVDAQGEVVYGNIIYTIGGTIGVSYYSNAVYYAPVSGTGAGGWTATKNYPINVLFQGGSCVAFNQNIYCVGGEDNLGHIFNAVYYAPILASNALGSWTATTNYPLNGLEVDCLLSSSNIYCVGGLGTSPKYNAVYYAPILASNALGSWTGVTNYPVNTMDASCNLYGNNIYCVGGFAALRTNSVYYAPVLSSNALGSWTATTNYPINTVTPCVQYSNSIFCTGGSTTGPDTNAVYYAPILSSNALGSWTATTNYPVNVANEGCVGYSNDILCVGGTTGTGSTYTNSVYYAPITGAGGAGASVGAWTLAGTTTISVSNFPTCVLSNSIIYCLGGEQLGGGVTYNSVYYAPILASNALGTWNQAATNYPFSLGYISCSTYNSVIYCVGGLTIGLHGVNSVEYGLAQSTGVSTWTPGGNYPFSLYSTSCVTDSNMIYCIGGSGSTSGPTYNSAYYAPIYANTAIGNWVSMTSYPVNANPDCMAYNNDIYCISGPNNNIYYAPILANAAIGTWSSGTANYPLVSAGGCVAYSNDIFCTSGSSDGLYDGGSNSIYYAPISSTGVGAWTYLVTPLFPMNTFEQYCATFGNAIYCGGGVTQGGTRFWPQFYWAYLTGTTVSSGSSSTIFGTPPYSYYYYVANAINNFVMQIGSDVSDFATSNTFAWTIPSNMGGNVLVANVVITDSATTQATANSIFSNVLTIPGAGSACLTNSAPSMINFGSINPTNSVNTQNQIIDTNSGSVAAYMYVFGGNWIVTSSQLNGFGISNTTWATGSGVSYASATKLSTSPYNTLQLVPAGGSNSVWFGLNIPPATTATTFNQIITIENSC